MKTRFRNEGDDWQSGGLKITAPQVLNRIRECIESRGPVILEHRFYRGSSAPDHKIFSDFDELMEYLTSATFAGDAIYIWDFSGCCNDDNVLACGKCPDESGRIPKGGAY